VGAAHGIAFAALLADPSRMIRSSLIWIAALAMFPLPAEGRQGVVPIPVRVDTKEDITATVLELSDARGNITLALQVEDARTGKLNRSFIETLGRISDLKVVNRSRVVVISRLESDRWSVMLFDASTARMVDSFEALKVQISPDGRMIRFTDPADAMAKVFDVQKMAIAKSSGDEAAAVRALSQGTLLEAQTVLKNLRDEPWLLTSPVREAVVGLLKRTLADLPGLAGLPDGTAESFLADLAVVTSQLKDPKLLPYIVKIPTPALDAVFLAFGEAALLPASQQFGNPESPSSLRANLLTASCAVVRQSTVSAGSKQSVARMVTTVLSKNADPAILEAGIRSVDCGGTASADLLKSLNAVELRRRGFTEGKAMDQLLALASKAGGGLYRP
jgi:hypothetical protein